MRSPAANRRARRARNRARTARCRQLEILNYFGERAAEPCGSCDNCEGAKSQSHARGVRVDSELLADPVRKALSGVARGRGRYGKGLIAKMLCGSEATQVRQAGRSLCCRTASRSCLAIPGCAS